MNDQDDIYSPPGYGSPQTQEDLDTIEDFWKEQHAENLYWEQLRLKKALENQIPNHAKPQP